MSGIPSRLWMHLALAAVMLAGCSTKRHPPPPPPAKPAATVPSLTVILLAEETGKQGRVAVTNALGSRELTTANTAVQVQSGSAPLAPVDAPEAQWKPRFEAMLAALPAAPVVFHLYFIENTTNLNEDSVRRLPDILRAIEERKSTDISLTGHTDTTGASDTNERLARDRADAMAKLFAGRGINPDHLFVSSHGEADLLVPTADNVQEERNRRVEVIVR